MLGAIIHTLLAAVSVALALLALHFTEIDAMWLGVVASIAPFLFYGREMRDHQRERQSEGIGHRNSFHLLDLVPGVRPFRIGTLADWVGPVTVFVAFLVVYAKYF